MEFMHLADAHLDSPFQGLSFLPSNEFKNIKQSTQKSFTKAIDTALDRNVDLVLIAGDTFDSAHPSPQSQLFFSREIQRLTDKKIQVVMILGNHDYLNPDEMLLPQTPYFKLLGSNEEVEEFESKTKEDFPYTVVGFSYQHNHIETDKISEFPKKGDNFTIGLMHAGTKTTTNYQNVYAPFTTAEIKDLNYNYFALGHIHLRQTLSKDPLIVYSGNLQGRHINEQGSKGVYIGTVDETTKKVSLDFVETAPIIWQMATLTLDQEISQKDLTRQIVEILTKQNVQQTLFGLTIEGAQYLSEKELELVKDSDYWLQLSNSLKFDSRLVKVYLTNNEKLQLRTADKEAFDQAENETFELDKIYALASDLSKKSDYVADILKKPEFIDEVKELAQVKLGQKLKDIDDEVNSN
ncbi:DNA repair exonuclease [Lactobacillus johnsonii]|jgi:DNA repair exonuclease SbcCD nuclease subunit|uniref:metallophosphoesterase family protein n=1 Tax=Lactobacillus johnsonii TaxID=33959 RepID=UPI000A3C7680|nr:DNA repair exonuclease [Lactobacillus johnsonii]AYN50134.1 putative metallophosphoesterase YhaO [Lactobacillus johnsonii]MCT3383297.1 DNA repair exonuclease [Lactobacillus johnsonii]MCT3386834.1 DNA repair exonuclease [Lactobacillus johnsonii]MDD7007212.1 DNA repair exonuclease [Lactobacillus johnsonii]MDY6195457.1 DNA repair exonuclease [Lactobacillus johnsonii]